MQSELMEYQLLKQEVAKMEERLEEYCGAIEDLGLACATDLVQDERVIYCRADSYTPRHFLMLARQEAELLEKTSQQMTEARGRVLSKILGQTENIAQYRAVRFACVDLYEQLAMDKSSANI